MTVSQNSTGSASSMTCLDHDHRKSKNVSFLAVHSLHQDFWGTPSQAVAMMSCGALDGIQVFGDRGEAEIRDACMTGVVHKDIWLAECQCCSKRGSRTTAYSLDIPVNYIASMKVSETLSDVR